MQAYTGRYALWDMNVSWENKWHGISTFGYMWAIMFVPQCGQRKHCLVLLSSCTVCDVSLFLRIAQDVVVVKKLCVFCVPHPKAVYVNKTMLILAGAFATNVANGV